MRGFLWYDFHPLQIELGRDKLQMGPTKSSLFPSPDLPFLDMLRLRLPLGRLTGDLVISTLENRPSAYDVPDTVGPPFGPSIILVAIHRWEYAFDTVRLGIGAMCVYARDGNAFNLGDIFPVFSWHQADIGPNNTSFVADASWVPTPRLTLSAQVGLDDVNLSGVGVDDSAAPTIPAVILNADYLLEIRIWLQSRLRHRGGLYPLSVGELRPRFDGNRLSRTGHRPLPHGWRHASCFPSARRMVRAPPG